MKDRITYLANGDRHYFLNDVEVTEDAYKEVTLLRDQAALKLMLETQRPPRGVSDCTFMKGASRQFENNTAAGDYYRSVAEANGGRTTGKKYLSGLARYPGDPEAWVDSRGDVEKIVEKRGWGCEGSINIKAREMAAPPEPGPDVADDLLDQYTAEIAATDPNPHLVDTADLREQVRERIKPKHRKATATTATEQ